MASTFCGKNCDECSLRDQLGCPGCSAGPGRPGGEECLLARCCREKGHETCEGCSFRSGCGRLAGKDQQPEQRLKRLAVHRENQARLARDIPFLGKWLWYLFWLVIPSVAGSLLTNETLVSFFPGLALPGQVISTATLLAYSLILLKLGEKNSRYRTSGLCSLAAAAFNLLSALFPEMGGVAVLLALPAAALALVGEYQEYHGHSEATDTLNPQLADQWLRLWKWYIGMFLALLAGFLLLFLSPTLALLVLLAAAIAAIVVSIRKLVLLYRTAQFFRLYAAANFQ